MARLTNECVKKADKRIKEAMRKYFESQDKDANGTAAIMPSFALANVN